MEHLGDMMGVGAKGQEEPPFSGSEAPSWRWLQNVVPSSVTEASSMEAAWAVGEGWSCYSP